MLKQFVVSNFKNFKERTIFNLSSSNYEFNNNVVNNDCVSKAIVFGINGSGKSNLSLALFDIIIHLTDKERIVKKYIPYLNFDSKKKIAEFEYHFVFDQVDVLYKYGKTNANSLVYENLFINDQEVVSYDYSRNEGFTILKGAENLDLEQKESTVVNNISRVKYIKGNAILQDDLINKTFMSFVNYVDNMLMFYSVDEKGYQGLCSGSDSFTAGIIREGKLKEFEEFLRKNDINYNLIPVDINGEMDIFCKTANKPIRFYTIASTGTRSLALFYYWYIKMSNASLVVIDEFDAFYHFELSQSLVELIKSLTNTQVILTTHNTDLISNDILRPDAYFKIQNNKINSFDNSTEKELRKAHNIQKMYKAGSFNE